uniref:Uncharacterized protein n=1 Tax=Globodera rostochiensis TaxID=31243 RepID=A0A914I9F5_GLORO
MGGGFADTFSFSYRLMLIWLMRLIRLFVPTLFCFLTCSPTTFVAQPSPIHLSPHDNFKQFIHITNAIQQIKPND